MMKAPFRTLNNVRNSYYRKKYNKYYDEYKLLDIEQLDFKKATLKFNVFFSSGLSMLVAFFILAVTVIITYKIAGDSLYIQIASSEISKTDLQTRHALMETVNDEYNNAIVFLLPMCGIVMASTILVQKGYAENEFRLSILNDIRERKIREEERLAKISESVSIL